MSAIVTFEGITKRYPGTLALSDIRFSIDEGEIHALVGANGAGKSTLMNILGGTAHPDEGRLMFKGKPVSIRDPHHARQLGISVVYQELRLCENMTIAENLVLGRERIGYLGAVDRKHALEEARRALDLISCGLDPSRKVSDLSISQKQLVEIARAIAHDSRLLILDEPTSSLTVNETRVLFENLRLLKSKGVTIIFISHRLDEVFSLCERISVLRDGRYLGSFEASDVSKEKIVELIAGRSIVKAADPSRTRVAAAAVPPLAVRNLSRIGKFKDVSFRLDEREILGIYGLQGAGRTELLECLFGMARSYGGEVLVRGEPVRLDSPERAISAGLAMVPEDRRGVGLFLNMNISENICVSVPEKISAAAVLLGRKVRELSAGFARDMEIKMSSLGQAVGSLSGGNQQKVVLSRWLATDPRILLLDEVTRGVDVGAKAEIYKNLKKLRDRGLSIVLVSSELEEIVAECDRTLVMWQGRMVGELYGADMTPERVLSLAMGLDSAPDTQTGHPAERGDGNARS